MTRNCGITEDDITELKPGQIFVFGSNLAGFHSGGAARIARIWGAVWGVGEGLKGFTYALPTMGENYGALPLREIENHVRSMYAIITKYPHLHFLITKVGCGIAGFSVSQIAPMFKGFISLNNCSLPIEFINYIEQKPN